MTCSTSRYVYGTLPDPWNVCIYRAWKNSMPKIREVIVWTKTDLLSGNCMSDMLPCGAMDHESDSD